MFEFKLTPAYCLFNGTAIIEQHGSEILFMVENLEDVVLQGRLKRAFNNYLQTVCKLEDCPEAYKGECKVQFVKGSRDQLRHCVSGLYKVDFAESEGLEAKKSAENQKEAAAILLLDSILHEAREKKATDIHIEKNCVRFRICGRLEKELELQPERSGELVQRIKLLAGMNVIERHKCQNGRFVYGKSNPIFVRVSTVAVIGTNYLGDESVVLRLLDTSRIPLTLNLLGFNENQLEKIREISHLKNGLVLVCGPTGAGKSTTVASILVELEREANGKMKIISMEDPPEYVIPGVSQIQVDKEHFYSYDQTLSQVFRQDPDVIMIGEIRDEVSASVALRAALTGHLVFATLHTGSPGEALLRLENLGLERKLIASVICGVVCQELNYMEEGFYLCADVSLPKERFASKLGKFMASEEVDELFTHETNYESVFDQTLQALSRGKFAHKRLWKGGSLDQKVHKRIG